MASATDIANQALSRIGAKTIMDMDDDTNPSARIVKNVYEQSVRELGRRHRWNCLKARSDLAQLATAPAFEWDYQYQLPTDCLRLLTVNGVDIGTIEDSHVIEGRKILTNAETCKITYIAYNADPTGYDPMMIAALTVLLASKIATSIRQDEQLAMSLNQEYEDVTLPAARKADGNEDRPKRFRPVDHSDWVKSRTLSTNG